MGTSFPSDQETLAEAALTYASWGWPVHPLRPQAKVPLTSRGLLDATTSPEIVEAWWTQWPTANIGLRTGIAFDVLDIDGEDGLSSLSDLAPGYTHIGPVSSTGRGWHLLFAPTGRRNGANLRPKLDFRGQNGYIVAPPSVHPSGGTYRWSRFVVPLPEAPDWLTQVSTDPAGDRKLKPLSALPFMGLDVIDELATTFPGLSFKRNGRVLKTECPLGTHSDTDPSFTVYPDTNSFYCFGCNAWGDGGNIRRFRTTGALR